MLDFLGRPKFPLSLHANGDQNWKVKNTQFSVNFSKKMFIAHMKEDIETSSKHLSVGLYLVPIKSYEHFKSDRKSLTFFVVVRFERSIAQKTQEKILIYSPVNRLEKSLSNQKLWPKNQNVGCRGYPQIFIILGRSKNQNRGKAPRGPEKVF